MPTKNRDIHDYLDIYLDPIVAIGTFLLGYWLAHIIYKRKTNNDLDERYAYFTLYVKHQKKAIFEQIKLIKDQLKKLQEYSNMAGLSIGLITQPYSVFDSINKELILKAHTSRENKDGNSFMNFLKFIEFTRATFSSYKDYHKGFIERQLMLRDKWNKKINEIHSMKAKLTQKPREEIDDDSNALYLIETYNNWGKIDDNSLQYTVDNLIHPLDSFFAEVYNRHPDSEFALVVLQKAQELELVYLEWQSEVEQYKNYLNLIIPRLDEDLGKAEF